MNDRYNASLARVSICQICQYNTLLFLEPLVYSYCICTYVQDDIKKDALGQIMTVLEGRLSGPINYLKELFKPFTEAYTLFKKVVRQIKTAWSMLQNG